MQTLGRKGIGIDSLNLSTSINVESKQALMPYTTTIGAAAATSNILGSLQGMRYFMPFYNRNEIYKVGGLSIAYVTNRPTATRKDTWAQWTEYTAANSTHLYHDSVNANVDAAVHNWNTQAGLSVGCWFHLDSLGAERCLISNWDAPAGDAVYRLYVTSANKLAFDVSGTGSYVASHNATVAGQTISGGVWYYATGRWGPGSYNHAALFDTTSFLESATVSTSITSTLYEPTTPRFRVGALISSGPTYSYMNGGIAYPWMAVTETSGVMRNDIWKMSRKMFQ